MLHPAHPLVPFAATIAAACSLGLAQAGAGAVPSTTTQEPRPVAAPVVVTATRTAQDPFTSTRVVDLLDADRLAETNARTTPQALRNLPSVMIQETAPGQGSPYVRGFTGYHNLFLIDGIRLNNSTFRSGPNQYWATVDPLSLDRIEVLRGTASSLYGSDAIGGTVQAFTKSPTRYAGNGAAYGGSLFGRYATAEDSLMGRIEFEVGQTWGDGSRTGILLGADDRSFGTLEGGQATGNQPNTDHEESAGDVKVEHWFDQHRKLVFLHQRMDQRDVPRTHATVYGERYAGTARGTDLQRDLDQRRSLTYLQYHDTGRGGLIDGMHLSVSWQEQAEYEDRVTSANVSRLQDFEVGTIGAFAQFETDAGALGELTWGVDYYHDNVNSGFWRSSGGNNNDPIQGQVANDARYDLLGVFLQDRVPVGDRVEAQLGVRYTYAGVDADSVRDPSIGASQNAKIAIKDDWDEFTASAHLRGDLVPSKWNVFGGLSQGFRAPSLADLTLFDSARSGETEVPSPGLEPEHYLGYELGTRFRIDRVQGMVAWFRTDIDDQIQRYPTGNTVNNGAEISKNNSGDGYLEGVEAQLAVEVLQQTTWYASGSYQYGRLENYNATNSAITEEFPSRLMPLTLVTGLRWENATGTFHAASDVVRAEDADKLSAADARDTQRIPPGGTPGYTIWNLRCGWQVTERTDFEFALENVTDVDYRVHGSGSNAPGRSFVVGMRTTF